jgi:hydrogenase maturation protease
MSAWPPLIVIGVGNRDRGDDAVGPIVCDLVNDQQLPGIRTIVFEGSVLDLPIHWSTSDRVMIVDAAEPAGEPGRITEFNGLSEQLTVPGSLSTHTIDVGTAIKLARALDRLPKQLTVVGIEGADFEFDAPLTPAVQQAAGRVVTMIRRS